MKVVEELAKGDRSLVDQFDLHDGVLTQFDEMAARVFILACFASREGIDVLMPAIRALLKAKAFYDGDTMEPGETRTGD